jgi:enamine deaminase RidA (YjgF/YER057c/UK114 family)
MSKIELRLKELGIILPAAAKPVATYVPAKRVGNLVYTSGNDCRVNGVLKYTGKLGSDVTVEQGYEAAKITMINLLAVLKEHLGDLDRVKQVVKILGFVNSADGFVEQPFVINGASDFLVEVFGEKGKHARSAISSNELPFNTSVEIEMIIEIEG